MKEVKHYICEICGTEYNEKSKAQACEKGHKKPIKITENITYQSNDRTGLPTYIYVEFDDKSRYRYRRG